MGVFCTRKWDGSLPWRWFAGDQNWTAEPLERGMSGVNILSPSPEILISDSVKTWIPGLQQKDLKLRITKQLSLHPAQISLGAGSVFSVAI